MGLPPLLLLLVVSPAIATPLGNIYDGPYDGPDFAHNFGPNYGNDLGPKSLSFGDTTYGQRRSNSTVLCESNYGEQGVCMHAGACVGRGGRLEGSCGGIVAGASRATPTLGYQCCVFEASCGSRVSESVVHFQSPDFPETGMDALACNLLVRVRPRVCQLRLDFLDLIMPGPGPNGECTNINNFKIMAPGAPLGLIGPGTDSLCGENTDNHLYVPVTSGDNVQLLATLSGIGAVPLATTIGSLSSDIAYKWNVRITQVECESYDPIMKELEAPTNCLQYFTATSGKFKSFNFDRFSIFAPNQDYAACFADRSGRRACSVTLRADSFGLPVDTARSINIPDTSVPTPRNPPIEGAPCQGGNIILDATVACCSHATSSHLRFLVEVSGAPGVAGALPAVNDRMRSLFCGNVLGPVNEITGTFGAPFVVRIYGGDHRFPLAPDAAAVADPDPTIARGEVANGIDQDMTGFEINYKINTGMC